MKLFFVLSGEHKTLPKAEVVATLESIGAKFDILDSLDQVLVIETDKLDGIKRLALTHKICEFFGSCSADFTETIALAEKTDIKILDNFSVRIKRIKEHAEEVKTVDLERKIGEIVKKKSNVNVDLVTPKNVIYGILTDKFVIGRILYNIDRSQYEKRRPHQRPYFHPGAMLPRNSRAIVNLTRVKEGEVLIDPFCGTGGFLIEAGLIGARVYGCDIEGEMIGGCEKNLQYYGIEEYKLEVSDARKLKEKYHNFFDAIATDPPYGISASTKGLKLEELYEGSLESFYEILKPKKYACIIGPRQIELEKIAEDVGFRIIETHLERIHRSLTRKIVVTRK